jgi:hypothetical protein
MPQRLAFPERTTTETIQLQLTSSDITEITPLGGLKSGRILYEAPSDVVGATGRVFRVLVGSQDNSPSAPVSGVGCGVLAFDIPLSEIKEGIIPAARVLGCDLFADVLSEANAGQSGNIDITAPFTGFGISRQTLLETFGFRVVPHSTANTL